MYISLICILAVLYPSIWFIDAIFAALADRGVKLATWVVVILVLLWNAWRRRVIGRFPLYWKHMPVPAILLLCAVVYTVIRTLISPPVFNLNQQMSLVALCPVAAMAGIVADRRWATHILGAVGGSLVVVILSSWLSGHVDLFAVSFQEVGIATTNYDTENNTGYQGLSMQCGLLGVWALCIIGQVGLSSGRHISMTLFGLVCLSVISIGVLGSRTHILALGVTLAITLIVAWRGWRSALAAMVVLGASILAVQSMWSSDSMPLAIRRLLFMFESSSDSTYRSLLWVQAFDLWTQDWFTLLIGIGPQQFPSAAGYNDPGMYPHSAIFELCCEYGMIGASLWLSLIMYPLIAVRSPGSAIRIYAVWYVYFAICYVTSGAVHTLWPMVFIAFLMIPDGRINSESLTSATRTSGGMPSHIHP